MAAAQSNRSSWAYGLRLVLPATLALVAYPGMFVTLTASGPVVLACAVVAFGGASLAWVSAWAPPPGDPDVHDRQVDILLGAPLLAAASWLSWTSPRPPVTTALSDLGVVSFVLFLSATSLLVFGTRFAARLRWLLLLPLLAMPACTGRPVLMVTVLAVTLSVVLRPVLRVRWTRRSHPLSASQWSRGQAQSMPPKRSVTAALTGLVALVLVVSSLSVPAARSGGSLDGPVAHVPAGRR